VTCDTPSLSGGFNFMKNLINETEMARILCALSGSETDISQLIDLTDWTPEKLSEVTQALLNSGNCENQAHILYGWSHFLLEMATSLKVDVQSRPSDKDFELSMVVCHVFDRQGALYPYFSKRWSDLTEHMFETIRIFYEDSESTFESFMKNKMLMLPNLSAKSRVANAI
jgi:hypothetical protein